MVDLVNGEFLQFIIDHDRGRFLICRVRLSGGVEVGREVLNDQSLVEAVDFLKDTKAIIERDASFWLQAQRHERMREMADGRKIVLSSNFGRGPIVIQPEQIDPLITSLNELKQGLKGTPEKNGGAL